MAATSFADCETIGENTADFVADVPAGQVREMSGEILLPDLPRVMGKFIYQMKFLKVKSFDG